jgi:hypothetical protein
MASASISNDRSIAAEPSIGMMALRVWVEWRVDA